jgi:hypothetical protein
LPLPLAGNEHPVGSRSVLVVVTEPVDPDVLSRELQSELGPEDETYIVASTSLSTLEWLTNDEEEARQEAAELAEHGAEAVGEPSDAKVGDPDPLQATEDALRIFPADEIIVARPEGTDVNMVAFEAFELPLRVLDVPSY